MNKIKILLAVMVIAFAFSFNAEAIPTETVYNDFFFLGDLHTYDYASHMDLERTWIGTRDRYVDELYWSHSLPDGFSVPPYEITRARLWIDGAFIGTDNNEVAIQGLFDWDPLNHRFFDNTTFNLTDIDDAGFWNNGSIDVTVFAGERGLRLDNAILMFDYGSASSASTVPEPATLALFGLGLAGLGIARRKK